MGEQLRLADRLGGLFIVSDSGYGPNRHCITLVSQWHSLSAPDAPVGARVKFTPAQGAIVVRFEQDEENVVWSVSDTGEGIPDDKLEAVFDRFVQLTKNDRRGVGLGLFIAKPASLTSGSAASAREIDRSERDVAITVAKYVD